MVLNRNRLCVFVVYDSENIIDEYIPGILKEIKAEVDKLIVICNFEKKQKIKYADEVIFRENIGLDGGAYKDYILEHYQEITDTYDELILTNDSYYGPLFELSDVFSTMGKVECDYWGITRYPGDEEGKYPDHIQSYFLVLKNQIFTSDEFIKFWKEFEYPENINDAVQKYELGLNKILEKGGFNGSTYQEIKGEGTCLESNVNPYIKYSMELIADCEIPFLKRKSLTISNPFLQNALSAIAYIDEKTRYDANYIRKHIYRLSKKKCGEYPFDMDELDKFIEDHSKIYVYGHGLWGNNMASYLRFRQGKFEKFVVTEPSQAGEISLDDVELCDGVGVIIAIKDKSVIGEILQRVKTRFDKRDVLYPY